MTYHRNTPLPLWSRVIFVDWHGVLSRRLFWSSVAHDADYESLDLGNRVGQLFGREDLVGAWMRGEIDTRTVVDSHLIPGVSESVAKSLRDVPAMEIRRARLRADIVRSLKLLRSDSMVVVATDNVDSFASGMEARSPEGQFWKVFDDFLSSAEIGVTKSSAEKFFGAWLADHDLAFSRAVLIDDSPENCRAFREVGGRAILFDDSAECWDSLYSLSG